jgi:hypothetical protein
LSGVTASMMLDGPLNGWAFLACVEHLVASYSRTTPQI